ncbi:hypothetical protein T484DRAFT_1935256 [Baffinella frigidus]|nr:hypothetical protein T484DRAFT_1935256 [Cryptophyta sp. CCMP2293]
MLMKLWGSNKPPAALNQAISEASRHVPHAVSFEGTKLVIRAARNHPTNWLAQDHNNDMMI